jgi:diguanylate cyclase (GGDEF)-like protein
MKEVRPLTSLQTLEVSSRGLGERLRLGIAARLLVAFIGVAVLAAAANLIVESGVSIVRTTQVRRFAAPLASAPTPDAHAEDRVATGARAPERRLVRSDTLHSAMNELSHSVRDRSRIDTTDTTAQYEQALQAFNAASAAFTRQAHAISGHSYDVLASNLHAHAQRGAELVLMADQQRKLLDDYAARLDGANRRLQASLERSWKIFNHLLAPESLVRLRAALDALRNSSAVLNADADIDDTALAPLLDVEQTLLKTLEGNARGLRRSEGENWYAAMHADVAYLMATRATLQQSAERLRAAGDAFEQETEALERSLPAKVEAVEPTVPAVAAAAPRHPAANPALDAPRASAPVAPGSATAGGVLESQSVTAPATTDQDNRLLVRSVSAAVLLLLLYISLATVWSIVRPVRRLLDATARLAKGDSSVRVRRGGIRELDTLAVAFNEMAERLAEAQAATLDYQQVLEAKVAQRTHQLQELAERDPLTGLPNRRELFVLLNAAIDRAQRAGHYVAVFFLDIDNFKYINDCMGHAFGDRVLVSLARRLQDTTQEFGFAARLGGDEFTVVYERAPSAEDIRAAGLKVVKAFQSPLTVDGRDVVVSVSVGASIYPDHEQNAEALLRAADAALFRAKALGRSQLSVFTPELLEAAAAKFTTEQGLRRAIERGEFELVYQPEVSVETLEATLVEALIRWRMPDGSYAAPGQFLAIAEESGLIVEISDWVLRSAIETAARWHHGSWPQARVAINVSPRQLFDHRFVDYLLELLQVYRLPSRCIEIELTESVLQTGAATIDTLKRLRAHGVAIALDDFGTGYSSLSSLERLPLTRIKLDRSLVAGIDTSARSAAIARAIIDMCQGLGLEITAEGVERSEQFSMLLMHRAMCLQGYLLARPVPAEELLPLLASLTGHMHELLVQTRHRLPAPNVVDALPVPLLRLPVRG